MFQNMLTVGAQVLILFLLILMGYIAGKTKLFTAGAAAGMSNIILYFVSPCMILNAFQRDYDPSMLKGLLLAFAAGAIGHGVAILLAHLLVRDPDKRRECVYRFCIVFSNCGYMSFPLQRALLGETGVFYGTAYVTMFNILIWSYGILLMSRSFGAKKNAPAQGEKVFSISKILLNPGILSACVGLVFFFCSIRLPNVLASPIASMAALNTPMPMFLIGYYLSNARFGTILRSRKAYYVIAMRLLAVPLIVFGCYLLLDLRGPVLIACTIAVSAPAAAMGPVFSERFGDDTETSVGLVSLSTVLSIITMPVVVGLAQSFA
ncbi:MAG: AEC family transporter [Firmicutes bacterium]|nr:AEC family transporter [Bacillota bacterium]